LKRRQKNVQNSRCRFSAQAIDLGRREPITFSALKPDVTMLEVIEKLIILQDRDRKLIRVKTN